MLNRGKYVISVIMIAVMASLNCLSVVHASEVPLVWTTDDEPITEILTEEEIVLMQEQEVYIVGYIEDFVPMTYLDADGEVVGASVDALNLIGDALGISFEYVNLNESGANINEVDICLSTNTASTGMMEKKSIAYYSLAYVAIHNVEHSMESDLPVGILEYFELSRHEVTDLFGAVNVIVYDSFSEMNVAFDAGEIQTMLLNSARYNNVKNEIEDTSYSVEILNGYYECCFYYTNHFSEEKMEIIDKVIERMDSQVLSYSILNHSTYDEEEQSLFELLRENPVRIIQIGLVIFLFISGIMIMFIALYERGRKKALTKSLMVDTVTGLGTAHYFEMKLKQLMDENSEKEYTIVTLDIDNFKYVNEIYGHAIGTEVLFQLGKVIKESMDNIVLLARANGDQYLVLMEAQDITQDFLQRSKDFLENEFTKADYGLGEDYQFSFSIGYYHIVDKSADVRYMINCARFAQDLGKQTIGCTIYEFTPQMSADRAMNNQIVATMDYGLRNKEFVIFYQPKVDLETNRIVGAEALIRWVRNDKIVSPGEFISIFEKNGFIEKIDYYVLEEVCKYINRCNHRDMPRVSVNLSTITMMKSKVVKRILDILDENQVHPSQIELEITESAFIDEFENMVNKVRVLREVGFTIAMDDFGVGISNLNQLKNIPLDTLKIDRGFIVDSLKNDKGAVIARHIVTMAKELNLKTVAEGIETRGQLEFFKNLKCDEGQGYYYSRPVPEQEFLILLEQEK